MIRMIVWYNYTCKVKFALVLVRYLVAMSTSNKEPARGPAPAVNMACSFAATATAEVVAYPVDTIKTWAQTAGTQRSMVLIARDGLRSGGIGGLYEGVSLAVARLSMSTMALMTIPPIVAERVKASPGKWEQLTITATTPVVTFSVNAVLVPLETLKTRLQADGAHELTQRRAHGVADAARTFVAQHGAAALWSGTLPTILRTTVYWSVGNPVYRGAKHLLTGEGGLLPESSPVAHACCGVASSFIATAVSHPLDVAKTALQNQDMGRSSYRGMLDCLGTIWRLHGARGLAAGFVPRYARMGAWQLTFWLVYERGLLLMRHGRRD